jgi:hypothetical protein
MCSLVFFWFRFEDWASFVERLPRRGSILVLLYCWLSTLGVPAADHFGNMLVPGSIIDPRFTIPRYFAFYHPVNNWMYFAGGIVLARLMWSNPSDEVGSEMQGSQLQSVVPRHAWTDRLQQGAITVVSRFGASAALAALFIVIPLADWADPTNILFRTVHGYLAFPGFSLVVLAAAQEKDVLLALPSKIGLGKAVEYLGKISGPCYLLHKPLHEVQWWTLPLLHSKAASLAIAHSSKIAENAAIALEWASAHGLPLHWLLVLCGGAAANVMMIPLKRSQVPCLSATSPLLEISVSCTSMHKREDDCKSEPIDCPP